MKILILGSSGSLGNALYHVLKKKHGVFHNGIIKKKYDLTKINNVKKILKKKMLDIIFNCSAITNIELCEKSKKLAYSVNTKIVKNFFKIIKQRKLNSKFVQISTDHIYDQKKINAKSNENSKVKINNYYSKTKYEAEKICKKNNSIIFRVNFFKEMGSKSFPNWLIKKFKLKNKFFLVKDQYVSALSLNSLVKILDLGLKKILNRSGIYNIGTKDKISKIKFAIKLARKIDCFNNNFIEEKINNICKVKRSENMSMDVKKFEKDFKIKLPIHENEIKKISKFYL